MKDKHTIKAKLWKADGKAPWYFITVKKATADIIKLTTEPTFGWGQIKIVATIKETSWPTCLFPNKLGEFVIPVKASVRKAEKLEDEDIVTISFTIK